MFAFDSRSFVWVCVFRCKHFPARQSGVECLKPFRENRRSQVLPMYCTDITVPQCQNLTYTLGSLPNLFMQRNITEIQIEITFYNALLDTGCSPHLPLFLCGTYIPFCSSNGNPFMMPCRELCEEVQRDCLHHYMFLYGGLPWPNKLQCHRFPSRDLESERPCFMPGDTSNP